MFLGIDVGTGGTRSGAGKPARESWWSHRQPANTRADPRSEHIGWAEQEPEDWWRAAREAIAAERWSPGRLDRDRDSSPIGLTGQMHGCVMLDAEGKVLRPALIWCDPAHPAGVRLAGTPRSAASPPDRADLQPGPPQLHPHQAALGAHPSARNLRPHRPRPLPQGLRPLPHDRRVRDRHARRPAAPLLLDVAHRRWSAGSRRSRRNSDELAAAPV